jgi:hypothetical protein
MVVIRKDALPSNRLPALFHDPNLLGNIPQSGDDLFIAVIEGEDGIGNVDFATEIHDQLLSAAQIVSRDARIQMMNGLELETTVEKVQPDWAVHVHGCAEHFLWEGLVDSEVCSRHGKMREGNLHMQWSSDHMGKEEEKDSVGPVRNGAIENSVSKPRPEEYLSTQLKPPVPPRWSLLWSLPH